MKIGFYDSGLGGISVLKQFLARYPDHDYVYFADTARAPYGDKTEEQLISYVYEIFDFMQEQQVNYVISACNTSSMFLDKVDLSKYDFEVISLFDVMKQFFQDSIATEGMSCRRYACNKYDKPVAFLATSTNVDSKRYQEWDIDIHAIKCPKLVPLVEAGDLNLAKQEFLAYLKEAPAETTTAIVGCTHYSFLVPEQSKIEFIDPAKVIVRSKQIEDLMASADNFVDLPRSPANLSLAGSEHGAFKLEMFSSGDFDTFKALSTGLLGDLSERAEIASLSFSLA